MTRDVPPIALAFDGPRSLSDSKMKSSINSDRIFYKTAAMARFVSVDS